MSERPPGRRARAFTLIELLTVIVIVGVLAALTIPVIGAARERSRAALCAARLRGLAQAVLLLADEQRGNLPRSFHSAAAHRETDWAGAIAPKLSIATPLSEPRDNWFNRFFRCPSDPGLDPTLYSYGLNVHFELDPAGDDYAGAPATWRRLENIPAPSRTVLLAETRPVAYGDHLMAHLWGGVAAARNALVHDRHSGRACYAFADAHVASLRVEETFDPANGRDLWNPSKAR